MNEGGRKAVASLLAASLLWPAPAGAAVQLVQGAAVSRVPTATAVVFPGVMGGLSGGSLEPLLGAGLSAPRLSPGLPFSWSGTPLLETRGAAGTGSVLSAPAAAARVPGVAAPAAWALQASGGRSILEVSRRAGRLVVNGVAVPDRAQVAAMGAGEARDSGLAVMDALLGIRPRSVAAEPVPAAAGSAAPRASGLLRSAESGDRRKASPRASALAPMGREAPRSGGIAAGIRAAFAAVSRYAAAVAARVAGSVYGTRILHLHYPHRSWDHVTGDMASDDKIKATNGEHPAGALREILNRTGWAADNPAGLSISFTPALMEIARKLWGTGWIQRWREAIGWRTASGAPRMEMLLTGYHFLYGLLPWGPAGEALVRWNLRYHELLMKEFWGDPAPGQLRIFRPPEVGFSPEMVPALVKSGVQVVVVDSHHISRAMKGYDASGMQNLPPPNKADQRNAAPGPLDYFTSGKDGRNTKDVLPSAYLPHWLRVVDPADGKEYRVIVFPMAGGPSYIAGYQDFPNDIVQDVARRAGARPPVLGLDTDGDNAWGGGYSSYMESMPRLAHWLDTNGHRFGTIQEYLTRHPVPADDVLDWVEPGAWPNADWGTPELSRWLWPPIKSVNGQKPAFDPAAWNFKLQFHALLTMAVHCLLQAEAAFQQSSPGWELDMARVVKADSDPAAGPMERAVQAVLRAFDSGHVYYSPEKDFVQIPLLAAKAAYDAARNLLGDSSLLPPTIWGPNRFPWNPGGENRGEVYGWRSHAYAPEFDAYGFVHGAGGLKRVELKWRVSSDGRTSPAGENLLYAGAGPAVGAWNASPMELKDPYAQVDWSGLGAGERVRELPRFAHAHVSPGDDVLVDYYIEAEDAQGRVQRSPIRHVFVGPA